MGLAVGFDEGNGDGWAVVGLSVGTTDGEKDGDAVVGVGVGCILGAVGSAVGAGDGFVLGDVVVGCNVGAKETCVKVEPDIATRPPQGPEPGTHISRITYVCKGVPAGIE